MYNPKKLIKIAILSTLATPLIAQTNSTDDYTRAEAFAIKELTRFVGFQNTWDEISVKLIAKFRKVDPEGDGYSQKDKDMDKLFKESQRRARNLTQWLRYDLNGDSQVEDAELRSVAQKILLPSGLGMGNRISVRPTPEQVESIYLQLKERLKLPDENKDGVTTLAEMLEGAKNAKSMNSFTVNMIKQNQVSHAFDTDKNGVVSEAEYLTVIKGIFDRFDKNNDHKIDEVELAKLRNAQIETIKKRQLK
jgi:Ca2+-binding EF-hand superfamily protein